MWTPKQCANGKWSCINQNLDTTDQQWETEAEAAGWAAETNAKHAKWLEERKSQAVARAAERAKLKEAMPTRFLTSRGDGFEGSGK